MLVKKKLYSVMDEEGNLGYYLYDESNGEERMFALPAVFQSMAQKAKVSGVKLPGATKFNTSLKKEEILNSLQRGNTIRPRKVNASSLEDGKIQGITSGGASTFGKA